MPKDDMSQETRNCQNCHGQFVIEPDDFAFYEKMAVPAPTWCPDCRFQRRLAFRNERAFYKRKCARCGKDILAFFSPATPLVVYCYECWWSDEWDPFAYGQDYDFSRPFFVQFQELAMKVPVINKWGFDNVNCDYAGHTGYSKNVYLSSSVVRSEDTFYSYSVDKGKSIFDSLISGESESCYENINCQKAYRSSFLIDCRNCINSRFLFDCANCQDCFMSSNLRNKRFYIRNRAYSESAYRVEMEKILFDSYRTTQALIEEFSALQLQALHKYADIVASTNCTGNSIHNSKNVHRSFLVGTSENIKYCWRIPANFKDSYDISGALDSELVYEGVIAADHNYMVKFYIQGRSSKNLEYSMYCSFCTDIFGCVGMKKKQYCILNKQYTKEEYEALVPKVIAHMNEMPYVDQKGRVYKYGEFFPTELSPFAYNETAAQEYFPLTKEKAVERGFRWKDSEARNYSVTKFAPDLPDSIKDVSDGILNDTIGCVHEGKCLHQCATAFRVTPEELSFYRRMNLPVPRLCPNCRHYERLAQRNPLKLWHRQCMCDYQIHKNSAKHAHHPEGRCPNEFETSYASERSEVVYCEACYNAEVV